MKKPSREQVRRALMECGGITAAARALGYDSHQAFLYALNNRFKGLREELDLKPRIRRRSIIKEALAKRAAKEERAKREKYAWQKANTKGDWDKEAL